MLHGCVGGLEHTADNPAKTVDCLWAPAHRNQRNCHRGATRRSSLATVPEQNSRSPRMQSQPVFALLSSMNSKHRICLAAPTKVRYQFGNSATVCITDSSASLAPILRPFACSAAVFVVEPRCPCESSRSPQRMARASQTTLCPKVLALVVFPTCSCSGENPSLAC